MKLLRSTKIRLAILSVIVFTFTAAMVTAHYVRKWQLDRKATLWRIEGFSAYDDENYNDALQKIGKYLQQDKDKLDTHALFRYADSRRRIELPNRKHLFDSIAIMRRVIDKDPTNDKAAHVLLELFFTVGHETETVALADQILSLRPNDAEALLGKAASLVRLHRLEEALDTVQQLNRNHPEHLEGHELAFWIRSQLKHSPESIVDDARHLRDQHPQEVGFEILLASAHLLSGQTQEAIDIMRQAATLTPDNPELTIELARHLDQAQLFNESLALLERTAEIHADAELTRVLVRRWWEDRKYEKVLKLGDDRSLGHKASDDEIEDAAFRALSHAALGDESEARAIVDHLRVLESNSLAKAWAGIIDTFLLRESWDPAEALVHCRVALNRDIENPYFRFWLGETLVQLGEMDQAIEAYQRVVAARPSWSVPRVRLARTFLAVGHHDQARLVATTALHVLPRNPYVVITWAVVSAAGLDYSSKEKVLELLTAVEEIQERIPGEEESLFLQIELLLQLGRDLEATEFARQLVHPDAQPSETTLLRLAEMSRKSGLGLEEQVVRRVQELYGQNPSAVIVEANQLLVEGRPDEGLEVIEGALGSAGEEVRLNLELIWAQYLEAVHQEAKSDEGVLISRENGQAAEVDALGAWRGLADAYPQNIRVQRAVLNSRVTWTDRSLIDRTIERIKLLTGKEGINWRLARARWLVGSDQGDRDTAKAADLLLQVAHQVPNRAEPRILLGQALGRLGNLSAAAEHLNVAAALRPKAGPIQLDLAVLYQSQKDFERAKKHLDLALSLDNLTPAQLRRAAALLAEQGDEDKAISLIIRVGEVAKLTRQDYLMLAQLHKRAGQIEKVEEIVRTLIKDPDLTTVRFVSDFYASQDRLEEAQAVLQRLNNLEIKIDQREIALAQYERRFGTLEQTLNHYQAAVEANAANIEGWRGLIGTHVRLDQIQDALRDVDRAIGASPDGNHFVLVRAGLAALKQDAASPHFFIKPVILSLIDHPEHAAQLSDALQIIRKAGSDQQVDMLHNLRRLADRHPHVGPIQLLLAQAHFLYGDPNQAAKVAGQTMQAFPRDVASAKLAAQAMAKAERWHEALALAKQWQQRTPQDDWEADLVITEARLRLGDPPGAMRQIQPYVEFALDNPQTYAPVINSYARVLIARGEIDRAVELLEPLLTGSSRWRMTWFWLGLFAIEDPEVGLAWMEQLEPHVPSAAIDERVVLAQGFRILGARAGDRAMHERGQNILAALAELDHLTAKGWLLLGIMAEEAGAQEQAEIGYRHALEADDMLHQAANNLAMILVRKSTNLDEALRLMSKAIETQPNDPNYHDTLAQIHRALGHYGAAAESLRNAVSADPENLEWQIAMAETLLDAGELEEAEAVMGQIDHQVAPPAKVPPRLATRLESLRVESASLLNGSTDAP